MDQNHFLVFYIFFLQLKYQSCQELMTSHITSFWLSCANFNIGFEAVWDITDCNNPIPCYIDKRAVKVWETLVGGCSTPVLICIECSVAKYAYGRSNNAEIVSSGTDRYRESGRRGGSGDLPAEPASRTRRARGKGSDDEREDRAVRATGTKLDQGVDRRARRTWKRAVRERPCPCACAWKTDDLDPWQTGNR